MVGFIFFFFTLDLGGHSIPCTAQVKKKRTKLGGHQSLGTRLQILGPSGHQVVSRPPNGHLVFFSPA
jgi:hypothetical protein